MLLPFHGAFNAIFSKIPRRCHWAELLYGFQPFFLLITKTTYQKMIKNQ